VNNALTHGFAALARSSAFVFACRVTGAAFTLLLQVMLARWMGAAELGIYVLAFSWCVTLAAISQLGFAGAALRVIGQALAHDTPGKIWGFLKHVNLVVSLAGIVIATVAAIVFAVGPDQLEEGQLITFLLAMVIVPVLAFISIRCSIALAFRWFTVSYLWTEVARPISVCVIIAAIWLLTSSLTAPTVMIVQLVVMLVVAMILFVVLRRRLIAEVPAAPPEYETRAWFRIALPLMVIALFGTYYPEFMLILVGAHVPSEQIAIFNVCFRLATIVTFALTAVNSVMSPVASRLYATQDQNGLQAVVSRAAYLGFGVSVAAVIGFAIFGRFALGLFGTDFIVGYETMMILISAQLVRASAGPVIALLSVTGHQDRCLVVFGFGLIASVILIFWLVPIYGIRGAAVSVLLVTTCWSVWLHHLVKRHIGVHSSIFATFARI
jgi:O-antigen/teichoic acid export membrane protein